MDGQTGAQVPRTPRHGQEDTEGAGLYPDQPPRWRRRGRRRRAMPLWQELPLLLIVAFCLAVLIRTFLLQAFFIPSGSMETTLLIGDRVLVNKIVYDMRDPERGEVVVFRGTERWAPENRLVPQGGLFSRISRTIGDLVGLSQPGEKDFIKRVIGLPGDTVQCCDEEGNVLVNGVALNERTYLPDARNSPLDRAPVPGQCGSRAFAPVVVPPGQIFVMGDHRLVSQDSRCQGPVPIENVIGRAFVVVWPSDRWHGLPVPASFEGVPKRAGALPGPTSPGPASEGGAPSSASGAGLPLVLPLLLSLIVPARSRRRLWQPQRRLSE
jgi:signal peptidase I